MPNKNRKTQRADLTTADRTQRGILRAHLLQILRSGTSIGANVSEAQNAQSRADFLAKMTIASKEANETSYWLHLLHDNGYLTDPQFASLNTDMKRLLHKLIAIVKTTKESMQNQ